MKREIEILAPAGSYEGMRAAMNAGCDAVYIGGNSFGARAYANNLDEETLLRAIDEAHIRNKKLYLTVNTLVKEKERLEQLYPFLEKFYLQGLDAVIVQDVGVMRFIHRHFPQLLIHSSTQTTLMMAEGANLLKGLGVTRMVTAREISLSEIKAIRESTDLEIETFVHGALCYCYSGQCLMSSMIGGRSGNRGRCAQPCRMPYQFYSEGKRILSEEEQYLLSPKDIATISSIPDMVEAGIDSFKIEGRMKRPEYAAAVAYTYRKYLDLYFDMGKEKYNKFLQKPNGEYGKDLMNLQDIYNRGGFSEGYLNRKNGKKMMSLHRPNHSGVLVGEVKQVKGSQVIIYCKEEIHAQDVLEIRDGYEKDYEFTVKDPHKKGESLTTQTGKRPQQREAVGKGDKKDNKPKVGARVYRTRNNMLLDQLSSDYLQKDQKVNIKGVLKAKLGEKLELTIHYLDCTVTAYHQVVEEAKKQPMSEEKIYTQMIKTGETAYRFEELIIDVDNNIFVPVVWLNEIRRNGLELLTKAVVQKYRRNEIDNKNEINIRNNVNNTPIGISIYIQRQEQFEEAIAWQEVTAIHVDYDTLPQEELSRMARLASKAGKQIYLSLPYICRKTVYERLKKAMISLREDGFTGYIVKNLEELALMKEICHEDDPVIILNYNMYIFNKEAKEFYNELGVKHFTAPLELNYKELKNLSIMDCDMVVYGYLPMMVSAQCLHENTRGCNKTANPMDSYLVDRYQKKFYLQSNCMNCYNIIYNGQCLSLLKYAKEILELKPRNLRLDFTFETKEEMKNVMEQFIDVYLYNKQAKEGIMNYTTGHFKRGVE